MELIRDPNVAFIDCETTGLDPSRDRIIELTIQFGMQHPETWTVRFRPDLAVGETATAVHGISDEMLRSERSFSSYTTELIARIERASAISGFRLNFDLSMLTAEFERNGGVPERLSKIPQVDAYWLFRGESPNTLANVYERTFHRRYEKVHTSAGDASAVAELIENFLSANAPMVSSWTELADRCAALANLGAKS